MKKNWIINPVDKELVAMISGKYSISNVISEILVSRGFQDDFELLSFLKPEIFRMKSPFVIKDLLPAVMLIRNAIDNKQKIGIYSDSDLDGLSSLTLVLNFLSRTGISLVSDYPKNGESYGLNNGSIDYFHSEKVNLILTLDCGIRDFKEIEYAQSLGMQVIVCDHHETDKILPNCLCVDPKRCDSDFEFKDLAGVGVAFKLMHGLFYSYLPVFNKNIFLAYKSGTHTHIVKTTNGVTIGMNQCETSSLENMSFSKDDFIILLNAEAEEFNSAVFNGADVKKLDSCTFSNEVTDLLKKISFEFISFNYSIMVYLENISNLITFAFSEKTFSFLKEISPFVAIGTIADVVPLRGENRILVSMGLSELKASKIPSAMKIRELCFNDFSSKNIAWTIGPLLNAPGRFGRTELTALFFASSLNEINCVYEEIKSLNEKRKKLVDAAVAEINKSIELYDKGSFIFVANNFIHEGICGIIAGKLSDKYNKPAIVLSEGKNNLIKGSGRSPQNINILNFAEKISFVFERFGGHNQAFGFSIGTDRVDELLNLLQTEISNVDHEEVSYKIDTVIKAENINNSLLCNIEKLEPFGNHNPPVLICSKDILFDSFQLFGKNKEHLKLFLNGTEFVLWGAAEEAENFITMKHHVLYTISRSYFKNSNALRAEIYDFYGV